MNLRYTLPILIVLVSTLLTGCGKAPELPEVPPTPKPVVTARSANELQSVTRELTFPGIGAADIETTLVSKSAGAVRNLSIKLGDRVTIGQPILTVNDASQRGITSDQLDTSQVTQARLGVSQALQGYQLAQANYRTLLETTSKELDTIDLARRQAESGLENIGSTSEEQRTSALIAKETAATAQAQARLSLENVKKQISQSEADARTNARHDADTAVDTSNASLVFLNSIASLENPESGLLPYAQYLGSLKSSSYDEAEMAYDRATTFVDDYKRSSETDPIKRLELAKAVARETKAAADATKAIFDYTLSSVALPQTSSMGPSISSFQQQIGQTQAQMNGLVTQLENIKQGYDRLVLGNKTTLDAVTKSVELADQQYRSAEQAIANLDAGTESQVDQATFGRDSAKAQFDAAKARINGQLTSQQTQIELARLQYENALVALESLVDSRTVYSTLNGVVTNVLIEESESVQPGSPIATVSTIDELHVNTFVDQETALQLRIGMPATISSRLGESVTGTVMSIAPVPDPATKRTKIELSLPNDHPLTVGALMNVTIPITTSANATCVLLPLESVDVTNDGTTVFVIRDMKAIRLNVTIKRIYGETVEVSIPDLLESDRIVTKGANIIEDGEEVTVSE